MSRSGSMTSPTPRSVSATTKLALPSSDAGIASTVYISSAADRDGRQENPDRDERDHDSAAIKHHLRRQALRCVQTKVDEQVTQSVREVEERHRDKHEKVQLHERVAQHRHPCVVMAVDHTHDTEGAQDALDQDVYRNQDCGDHAPGREREPIEEVHQIRSLSGAHRPNQINVAPTTTEAAAQAPNIAAATSVEGSCRSKTLTRMITPERLRKVTL